MNQIVVLALIAKLSGAIVLRNSANHNDEPTEIPTEFFKPLTPLKENTLPVSNLVQPNNFDGRNSEIYGSPSNAKSREGNTFPAHMNNIVSYSGFGNGFTGIPQPQNIEPVVFQSSYKEITVPFPYQSQRPQAVYQLQPQVLNRGSFTQNGATGQGLGGVVNYGTEGSNTHYRVSSSHTYYNSDTMNASRIQHYQYDSRNGEAFIVV